MPVTLETVLPQLVEQNPGNRDAGTYRHQGEATGDRHHEHPEQQNKSGKLGVVL